MSKRVKYISPDIACIRAIETTQRLKINVEKHIQNKSGVLKKAKPKGYTIDIAPKLNERLDVGQVIKAFAENKKIALKITDAYVKSIGASVTKETQSHSMQIQIFSFCSKGFSRSKASYFRSIIPLSKKLTFFNLIETESFYNDELSSRGLVKLNFTGHEFEVYIIEREKKKYLCTECASKLTTEDFMEFNWSIKVALGYLLGHLPQDDEYFFAYNKREMKQSSGFIYQQQRDSIRTIYTPINTNPYGWKMKRSIADEYYGKIQEINSLQLSKLCELIYNEEDIKAILLLITESLSRSLLLMPAGLSVALEGLSSYFYQKDISKIRPIKDNSLGKRFISELKNIVDRYETEEGFTGYEILLSKILNINSPTNREKLKAPFSYQEINLTGVDEEILEYRNDFLHGNLNLKPQKGKKSYTMDSFEISLRLLTLLNMCILKMAGYCGYIINHVKMQEKGLNKKIKEDYYRII